MLLNWAGLEHSVTDTPCGISGRFSMRVGKNIADELRHLGDELTHWKELLQGCLMQKHRRKSRPCGLSRLHKTRLLRSAPEIRPPSTLPTASDGFRTRLWGRTTSPRGTGRAQVGDPIQDAGEPLPRDGDFRQLLEHDVLCVRHDTGSIRVVAHCGRPSR